MSWTGRKSSTSVSRILSGRRPLHHSPTSQVDFLHRHSSRPVATNSSDSHSGLLAKAAVSHLQLALINLDEHAYALRSEEHEEVRLAEAHLSRLAHSKRAEGSSPNAPISKASFSSDGLDEIRRVATVSGPMTLRSASDPSQPAANALEGSSAPLEDANWEVPGAIHEPPLELLQRGPSPSADPPMLEVSNDLPPIATRESVVFSEPWQQQLADLFDEIDVDNSGSIRGTELRKVLATLCVTPAKSQKLIQAMDNDGDGAVSRSEWRKMVESMGNKTAPREVQGFVEELLKLKGRTGRIYPRIEVRRERLMLLYDSSLRLAWDLFLTCLLAYIAVILPLMLGFSRFMSEGLLTCFDILETIIDCFFLLDIVLNFRTTFMDSEGNHITHGRQVALHYLKTWFTLDLVSSVPLDLMFGSLPNLQVAKLLKVGKVTKAIKILRLGRIMRHLEENEYVEEILMKSRWALKLASLAIVAFCVCHWLACFMAALSSTYLDGYQDLDNSLERRYLTAVYWAMTTMTTVGYGDIIPNSDTERAYSILAMILGGGFYGYVIGSITSVISTTDANTHAYRERIDLIQAWLDHHRELPKSVARRIRRHFKQILRSKTAINDATILGDLTPELRIELSRHIIDEEVRHNMLFEGLPNTALAKLLPILETCTVEVKDRLATTGEPGVAMFIVLEGTGHMFWNVQDRVVEKQIEAGDSFGEEIVLQLDQYYRYTVTATSQMSLHMIQEMAFQECFQAMPDQLLLMRENYMNLARPETSNSQALLQNMQRFRMQSRSSSNHQDSDEASATQK